MIRKLKWRYYCEFCQKGSASPSHMSKHESRCTLNPNRECGLCNLWAEDDETERGDMAAARAALPDGNEFIAAGHEWNTLADIGYREFGNLQSIVESMFHEIRALCKNCPACILAALRQSHIPVPMVIGFDFDKESKSRYAEYNASKQIDTTIMNTKAADPKRREVG